MDAAKDPLRGIWIGIMHQASSLYIEIVYETLPTYYCQCRAQGHNLKTCYWTDEGRKKGEMKRKEVKERVR